MAGGGNSGGFWPNAADYVEAVQNPSRVFDEPKLKASRPQTNKLGLPRTRAGAFANVYKFEHPGGAVAVRVFLYDSAERARRYKTVSDHLRTHRPGSIVDFAYHPEGIRVRGASFPIQTMEWVDGMILGNWVEKVVLAGDARALSEMAAKWTRLVQELARFQIAHGDLQHANVMVLHDGRPVLVDYDCMGVPGLFGMAPLERGLPPYQHPCRTNPRRCDPQGRPAPLAPTLDAFSALVIQTALRALAADLSLWKRFVVDTRSESLLFTEKDHADPAQSALYKALATSPDPDVAEWAAMLEGWARGPLDLNPGGADVIPSPDPYKPLRALIAQQDWERVAASPAKAGRPLPADLADAVAKAKARVGARDALAQALASRDPRRIVKARADAGALLEGWPAVQGLVAQVAPAARLAAMLDELKKAAGTPALLQAWRQHARQLPRIAEVAAYESEARLREAAASRDWDALAGLVAGAAAVPADLKTIGAEAQRKAGLRGKLEESVRTRDARRIASALTAAGRALDDWPSCRGLLDEARKVAAQVQALDRLKAAAGTPALEKAWDDVGAAVPATPEAEGYRAEVELRRAARLKDWDALAALVHPPGRLPIPADLRRIGAEAQQKAALREQLDEALRSGEVRRVDRALAAAGRVLDDWPSCRGLLDEARRGAAAVPWLDRLEAVRDTPALVDAWDRARPHLSGVADAEPYRREADRWRVRGDRLADLRRAAQAAAGDQALANAWAALEEAGGHPDARPLEARAREATRRARCLAAVRPLLGRRPGEQTDRDIDRLWDDGVMAGSSEADAARREVEQARRRLAAARRVEAEVDRPGEGADKERRIVEAARALPDGYAHAARSAARIQQARGRTAALDALARALVNGHDLAIARAWEESRRVNAPVDPAYAGRCQLAARRRDALATLARSIPATEPEDRQDALWLSLWDDALLRPSTDPAALAAQARHARARQRADDVAALEAALAAPDPSRVMELVGRLGDYPPLAPLRPRIDAALVDYRRVCAVKEGLEAYQRPAASRDEKDAADRAIRSALIDPARRRASTELLTTYRAEFQPRATALAKWLGERVLHQPPTPADPPILWDQQDPRVFRVRWSWPDELVAWHRVIAEASPPSRPGGAWVDRDALTQNAGFAVTLDKPQLFVGIWPIVRLGWTEFAGPPLVLGPISRSAQSRPPGPVTPPRPPVNPWARNATGTLDRN